LPVSGLTTRTAALAAVALVGVSGCSWKSDSRAPVAAAELQKAIVAQLAQAGTPSTWVNCPKDLPGKVGATTRCEVQFSSDNTVTALLTTTQVSGGEVTWEVTHGELTKEQLAKRVTGLTGAEAVTCQSDLDGRVDAWAQCEVTRYGVTTEEIVQVKSVKGLVMEIALGRRLPKDQLGQLLLSRVPAESGSLPESAVCAGDLVGFSGSTTECSVTFSPVPGQEVLVITYGLTATNVANGAIDFDFVIKGAVGGDPGVDYCSGCPG